jgi:hypothetical protein
MACSVWLTCTRTENQAGSRFGPGFAAEAFEFANGGGGGFEGAEDGPTEKPEKENGLNPPEEDEEPLQAMSVPHRFVTEEEKERERAIRASEDRRTRSRQGA